MLILITERHIIMDKISFFLPSFNIGGIERVFINYANTLSELNYYVDFVVCKPEGLLMSSLSHKVNIVSLGNIQLRKSVFRVRKYLKNSESSVVITGGDYPNIVLIMASAFLTHRPRIIISQHNYFNIETLQLGYWGRFTTLLTKILYPFADRVVAVSKGIYSDLKSKVKFTSGQLLYLPNPICIHAIHQLSSEAINYQLPDEYLIFVGRLSPVKNLSFLLEAFDEMKNTDVYLIIVGDGPEMASLVEQIARMKKGSMVKLLGAVSNPLPFVKRSSALVLPSLSEAFPTVLLEALSLNIPIVATPSKGAVEILKNVPNSIISKDFRNVSEFTRLLESVINSPIYDATSFVQKYSMEAIMPRLQNIINNLNRSLLCKL